jgi:hypothetical protein
MAVYEGYFHILILILKLLLPVSKINEKNFFSTQPVDSIATQCGGSDTIYAYFEGLSWRNALFNWVQPFFFTLTSEKSVYLMFTTILTIIYTLVQIHIRVPLI